MKEEREQVLIESPQQWRDWLAEHHATSSGIWLVMWRPASGKPQVTYEQAIEEALCFGWIDGQAQTLDADRTALWLTRRRPGSGWSVLSKQRVARVEADGRMTPVGRAVIDAAKADGSWSRYDDADNLVLPHDLVDALEPRRAPASTGSRSARPSAAASCAGSSTRSGTSRARPGSRRRRTWPSRESPPTSRFVARRLWSERTFCGQLPG